MAAPQPPPRPPQLRLSSERYLRAHPAVGGLLRGFLRELLLQRPDDVLEFAAGYFTRPELRSRMEELGGGSGGGAGCHPNNRQ